MIREVICWRIVNGKALPPPQQRWFCRRYTGGGHVGVLGIDGSGSASGARSYGPARCWPAPAHAGRRRADGRRLAEITHTDGTAPLALVRPRSRTAYHDGANVSPKWIGQADDFSPHHGLQRTDTTPMPRAWLRWPSAPPAGDGHGHHARSACTSRHLFEASRTQSSHFGIDGQTKIVMCRRETKNFLGMRLLRMSIHTMHTFFVA
jgi:hypothetical protein